MKTKKFYITTPIYYVTAKPHLGSLYSTVLADVCTRWNKLHAIDSFFLTGTDEHGQKIAQAASCAHKEPKEFVDGFIPEYKQIWNAYNIEYNAFARTTNHSHIVGAQQLVQKLIDGGYVYKSEYSGMYCTPCETFVTHNEAVCPSCKRETAFLKEETYFFKLSSFADKLLQFYADNPDFITPKERFNEVISFVKSGLNDLSISRTSVDWGVPFPGDEKHRIYVWVEALCIYITGIGYGNAHTHALFNQWWPADAQVIGKDIVRFHAVYWPAMLMAAELPLPKKLVVHGWITVNKQKMSKSLGNVIDPTELEKTYQADPVRYYLMRQMPINQDGDFSYDDLQVRIESDLANDLGNLLNRMVTLSHKYNILTVKQVQVWSGNSVELRDECLTMVDEVVQLMSEYMIHLAISRVWKFIKLINAYFHNQQPWKIAHEDPALLHEIIAATSNSLYAVAILLWPVMPHKMKELLAALGVDLVLGKNYIEYLQSESWNMTFVLHKIDPLFEKPVSEKTQQIVHKETQKQEKAGNIMINDTQTYITIDDVVKVDIRVGTIEHGEPVEGSDKLVKMTVNLGELGMRTILAGIKKSHSPESLKNKRGLFIVNLKPRAMAGHESQGMMLVAENKEGAVELLQAPEGVCNGMRLR